MNLRSLRGLRGVVGVDDHISRLAAEYYKTQLWKEKRKAKSLIVGAAARFRGLSREL